MTTYKEIFGKPIKVLPGDPAPSPITYTVTVQSVDGSNKYFIDGVLTPTLELYEGNTYNFDYSAATGHPFRFATAADAAGSTEYTTGVSVDSNITTIVVASGAPNLFYYCTNHSGMGGRALTPASPSEYEGQIWYNEGTGKFRSIVAGQAWSSSSNAITIMHAGQGFGGQSDAVGAGGYGPSLSPAYSNATDEYNGSGWNIGGSIGSARYTGQGCGSQTAGLIAGGNPVSNSEAFLGAEEYNGSSWTAGGSMATGHGYAWMAGIQTAAIVYTGLTDPSPATTTTNAEEYNGTAWSEVGNVNTAKYGILGFGATKDTAVKVGGSSANTGVEEYNGTSWTAVNSIPANRADGMGSGAQTSGLICAGNPGAYTSTLLYDGTNWTTSPATLATGRAGTARGATISNNSTSIVHHAGPGTAKMLLTEEYNFTTNTITAAAWSSSGVLPQGVSYNSGAGTQNAALSIAGQNPSTSIISTVYEYNGSSWADSGSPVNAFYGGASPPQSAQYMAAAGTQTAAIILGGGESTNVTVEYNGSSWTAGGTYPISQVAQSTMNGIQTAAINISGSGPPPGYTPVVANYNGSSWTASPVAFSPAARRMSSAGTYTATIVSGGSNTGTLTSAQEWDGSSWTTVGSPNAPKTDAKSTGIQTAALKMHGGGTESYDGSSWATAASMANNRSWCTGGSSNDASNTSAVVFGGSTPSFTDATEEYNGETTSLNYKNISSS